MNDPILEVNNLAVRYGSAAAVRDISLTLHHGEALYLLGRNGAGKTTTLKAIVSQLPKAAGRVIFEKTDITKWHTERIVRRGLGFVPAGRRAFADLSVRENLDLAARAFAKSGRSGYSLTEIYDLFPLLASIAGRPAGVISGGEQQMLKMGRALLGVGSVLLLDEPTEGLAPLVVRDVARALGKIRDDGKAVVIAEQRTDFVEALPGRVVEIERGVVHAS
jgi:branched-chain amino acid transport system ATP-binding protein